MAVSMSAGGSGYMRSDFMISDAAIPLRVEESMEQADNSGQFSQVLSSIGEAKKAVSTEVSGSAPDVAKDIPKDVQQELHQLVEAVANGELKLEDIPEEQLTQGMLEELTKLVKAEEAPEIKEEAPDFSKDPEAQELLAELTAMLSAQQTAVTPDDKTEELSALTVQPEEEAVQTVEVQPQVQVIPQQAVNPQQVEITQPVVQNAVLKTSQQPEMIVTEEATAQAAPEVFAAVPQETQEQPEAKPKAVEADKSEKPVQAEPKQHEANTETAAAVKQAPENSGESAEQQSSSAESGQSDVLGAKTEKPQEQTEAQPAEFSRIREDITSVEVKTARKAPETEQTEQREQPVFPQHTAQRSRVVSKSDELQMIKDAAKPADENTAQTMVQPQTLTAEKPVVFTRPDGGEVQVKPSEVAQQVVERLTEYTDSITEGETEYSVTLNPEDLGRITVRMTKTADGAVSVSIAAENSRTLKIIEDNGAAIQDTLKQNGVQLESWQTVGESRQETHAEDYQGSSKNPYRESNDKRQEQDSDGESFAEIIASM